MRKELSVINTSNMRNKNGQALIEVLIGLAIGGVVVGSIVGALGLILRSSSDTKNFQIAASLNQELADKVTAIAEANWLDIYDVPTKGTSTQYWVNTSGTIFIVATGTEALEIEGTNFTRFFSVENVMRDSSGDIVASGGDDDPSTQKITVYTRWLSGGDTSEATIVRYVTRWKNFVFQQSDWSGGGGQEGPLTEPNNKFSSSTSIDYSSVPGSIKLQGL